MTWDRKSVIFGYDIAAYGLADLVAAHFGVSNLSQLHRSGTRTYEIFRRENDQSSEFHKKFYTIGDAFYARYRAFVREVIAPRLGVAFVFQRIPTFRAQLPDNLAVGEFHRDRDYNHSVAEINFWLPFTDTQDSNTIWIESAAGREDCKPYNLKYGQALMFDGPNLKHGNQVNRTGRTRVSCDFRIIPMADFKPSGRTTINTGMKFEIGGYFDKL